jgi:outer membrane protein
MRVMQSPALRPLATAALVAGLAAPALAQVPSGGGPQTAGEPSRPVRRLTVDDAVQLGLENNLSLQVQRIDPRIQDANVAQARSAWTPVFTSSFTYNNADSPPDSLLAGSNETLESDRYAGSTGVAQRLPWFGSTFQASWDANRSTTNNRFSSFNPRLASGFAVAFTQPLLRNLEIDTSRQQFIISRNNREISDFDLQAAIASTSRNIRNAFWDLAYGVANLQAQQQSLDLARQTLKDNRTRVEVGTMAPIDIVEAEAEVARNEEAVIVAGATIEQAEDRLRALVFNPKQPDFWRTTIEPVYDESMFRPEPADPESAVGNALNRRTDLKSARKQLESTQVNVGYYRNQTRPEVNVEANFNGAGLGGTQVLREPGFPPGPVIGTIQRSFGSVIGDAFGFSYPTWTIGVSVSYPIGTSNADASLTRSRLQYDQGRLQIEDLELQIATQVRVAARSVNTNIKRIEATRAARVLAERRLEAEQKKFGVGMSTSFLVFQAQRDLTTARNNELRALVDYVKSRVDFEAIQESSLSGASSISGSSSGAVSGLTGQQ